MEEPGMASSDSLNARKKLVEEHMRAENAHDVTATMATLGRQPRYILNGVIIDGHEAIRAAYEGIGLSKAAAFSHFKVEVTGLHTGEEAIILEGMMSGTHVAEWQGVPATGRSFNIPVCAVFTFDAEEKLAGERIYFDSGLLLKQLGVLS
jgi:steroid delta-isomerase-like uncharacterized protein